MFELMIIVIFAGILLTGIIFFFFMMVKKYNYKKDNDPKKIMVPCRFSRDPWAKIDEEESQRMLEYFINGIPHSRPAVAKTQIQPIKNVISLSENISRVELCVKV